MAVNQLSLRTACDWVPKIILRVSGSLPPGAFYVLVFGSWFLDPGAANSQRGSLPSTASLVHNPFPAAC